jgi:hypothetical protein
VFKNTFFQNILIRECFGKSETCCSFGRIQFAPTNNLPARTGELNSPSINFLQLAGAFRKTKKPSCKLQECFGKPKNLPATCRSVSENQKTFLQVAGAFRKMKKPSCNLQERFGK